MGESKSKGGGGARRPRAGVAGLLWFLVPVLIFAGLWLQHPLVVGRELESIDWRFAMRGPLAVADEVVVIGIDDPCLQLVEANLFDESVFNVNRGLALMRGGFPWAREAHGILIDRLLGAGAKAVALDLLFTTPSKFGEEDDAAFAAALARHPGRVVIGANLANNVAEGAANSVTQVTDPIERLRLRSVEGLVNYFPDIDGVVRRVSYELAPEAIQDRAGVLSENQFKYLPTFPLQILRAAAATNRAEALGRNPVLIPFFGPGQMGDTAAMPIYPYYAVLDDKMWQLNFRGGEAVRGKIVLVGPTTPVFHDAHRTPFGEMNGVEIHAQVVAAALAGLRLTEVPPFSWLAILLACSMAAYTVPRMPQNAMLRLAALVAVMAAYIGLAQWFFQAHSVVVLLFTPLASMALVGIGIQAQDFWLEQRERLKLRRTLETHVSKNIADALMSDRDRFKSMLGGVRRPVTILFSDIRDFTAISENARPEELVAQLNEYLSGMVDCILLENGTLHKFIGDAVMAVWGDTVSEGEGSDARRAVRAGLHMFRRLTELNAVWERQGRLKMRMGVGINHGEVVVGNIGSTKRMEFTVIGDPVNLASRLEGATKEFHADILIGEDVFPLVKDEFLARSAGRIQVKGRSKPAQVYEVIAEARDPAPRISAPLIRTFEDAMTAYYNRRFGGAIALFEAFLAEQPGDFLARAYYEESLRFLESPPAEGWDGTYVMRTK